MKKGIKITGITLLILLIILAVYLKYPHRVTFEKVLKINCPKDSVDHDFGYTIIANGEDFIYAIDKLSIFRVYSTELRKESFDFDKNSYLISFGKEVKHLSYDWYYVYFEDRYYLKLERKSIPIKAEYNVDEKSNQFIVIYRIPKQPIYRNKL